MKKKFLEPAQLIAMIDYPPLHSPEAFAVYREKFKSNSPVEPITVVPTKIVLKHLSKNKTRYASDEKNLEQFLKDYPKAKYFMMGGKHRSAAATLLGLKIPSLVVENNNDVDAFNLLIKKGEITGVSGIGQNFTETLQELDDHYFEHGRFWTMDEKTKAMIKNGDITE